VEHPAKRLRKSLCDDKYQARIANGGEFGVLTDSPKLRELLSHFFPGIEILQNLRPSGQRMVYFCRFVRGEGLPGGWEAWGEVALKISPDIHPFAIARLEKERDILNDLQSAYFPRLLHSQVFTEDPDDAEEKLEYRLFVTVEERIVGRPLCDCRDDYRDESKVVELLRRLLPALRLLWDNPRRIVHRDLKPDNIMIRPCGSPVVIDLGIVREEGTAGVTGTNMIMGPCTPGYASPEQLRNDKLGINFRTDIFALGVIAYELLAGSNPFRRADSDPWEIVSHRTQTDAVASLASLGKARVAFSTLVDSMMAKDAYRRPRTIQELANRIEGISELSR
jgi:serine/threonine protein kinase